MNADDVEPLEPGHWMRRIQQLADRPLDDQADLERALRHALHLVQLVPRPLRHFIRCSCGEAEFEALLETHAYEAAVLRLIGPRTPYKLTKAEDAPGITAEVWYPDMDERQRATERSVELALFRAWLKCNGALGGPPESGIL